MRHLLLTLALLSVTTAAAAQEAAPQVTTQVAALAQPTLLPPPALASEITSEATTAKIVAVPVLKQAIQKGETISAENIVMQEIPASQAFASTIRDAQELAGQQATRPLIAGQPINKLHVRVAPLVSRNQSVTFVYRRGGVELSGRGQALDDGQVGQTVRITNTATRSTVTGVVLADGTVEMN